MVKTAGEDFTRELKIKIITAFVDNVFV